MLNRLNTFIISILTIFSLFSCEKNEQKVDAPSQLFRPAMLTVSVNANIVSFSWIPIKGSTYSLDLAKDNLLFTTDVQNFKIDGRAEFIAENLWSLSTYSVRIKCVSSDPNIKDSEYKMATFTTLQENIFSTPTASDIATNHILVKWDATRTVSHLIVTGGTLTNFVVPLSAQDIQTGQKDITGLSPMTSYVIKIYNGEMLRGSITTKTL